MEKELQELQGIATSRHEQLVAFNLETAVDMVDGQILHHLDARNSSIMGLKLCFRASLVLQDFSINSITISHPSFSPGLLKRRGLNLVQGGVAHRCKVDKAYNPESHYLPSSMASPALSPGRS